MPAKIQQLYRHSSGTFYARLKVGGKPRMAQIQNRTSLRSEGYWKMLLNDGAAREGRGTARNS